LYIQFVARPSTESEEIRPGVVLDLDGENNIVGIDIERASDKVDLRKLDAASLPL